MVTVNQIGWSSWGGYEGPRYIGNKRFVLPENPTFAEKAIFVVSASEGLVSSVNMYDRAIISAGLIQWAELINCNVSNMIGYITERCGLELIEMHLKPALVLSKATFKKTAAGKWRFHFIDGAGKEIAAEPDAPSRWLFARGSGKVGTWTDGTKLHAKVWAAAVASLLETEEAAAAQVEWTLPQLVSGFVFSQGRAVVFEQGSPESGYAGALKAFLVAYGVNLPAVAEKTISAAIKRTTFPRWSKQWCLDLIHDLALTSGVSIWPGRYDFKRPAAEQAFGITLPKNKAELAKRAWAHEQIEMVVDHAKVPSLIVADRPHESIEMSTAEVVVQRPDKPALPSGGFWAAIKTLQSTIVDKLRRR